MNQDSRTKPAMPHARDALKIQELTADLSSSIPPKPRTCRSRQYTKMLCNKESDLFLFISTRTDSSAMHARSKNQTDHCSPPSIRYQETQSSSPEPGRIKAPSDQRLRFFSLWSGAQAPLRHTSLGPRRPRKEESPYHRAPGLHQ